jgi:uncharacterized membrane protein HdeD (DUF308 family)
MRSGELLALLGAALVIFALTRPWYESAGRNLSAWDTFGPAVALLMLAAAGALVLAVATVAERSTALPVAAGVWSTTLGIIGVVAAVVRVLERPEHANGLCAGAWLALAGALLILGGSWQSMRDERPGRYPPPEIEARPPPPAQ